MPQAESPRRGKGKHRFLSFDIETRLSQLERERMFGAKGRYGEKPRGNSSRLLSFSFSERALIIVFSFAGQER